MKIVSLLPSATEIVCALGLREQLVGVTHECDFPPGVEQLPKVTKTLIPNDASSAEIDEMVRQQLRSAHALYTLDRELLSQLAPDWIVTQALCDVCAVAEEEVCDVALSLPGSPRVVNLEPQTLGQVLATMLALGEQLGVESMARGVVDDLRRRVERVRSRSRWLRHPPRVLLLEWLDPPFSSGHWNPEMVRLAGGVEVLGLAGKDSRTLSWEEVAGSEPEVVFVSCCGFGLERTLRDLEQLRSKRRWCQLPAVRAGRVYVTDGSQFFSRPGPRLVDSLEMLAHALHPSIHHLPEGVPEAVRLDTREPIEDQTAMGYRI